MKEIKSPLKAIREKCLDCCCGNIAEVRECTCDCVLKPFRFGKNPFVHRTFTEEQIKSFVERTKNTRKSKNE